MQPVLAINNLSISFQAVPATTAVSLTINKGELHAIVGESGSGKSVTALAILKLHPQPPVVYKEGKILFTHGDETVNILEADEERMRELRGDSIAMIFQEPMTSLNPLMQCGEQVMENLRNHRNISAQQAQKETISLFEQVQLPEPLTIFAKYPHQLSGGQKQRVMIAMAMVCKPALLICDEPTTALDVTVQKNILHLLKQLQQQHDMAVLFISHDLGVVSDIADTITVMYKGRIVEQGKAVDVLGRPQHPYTKALLACRPSLHSKNERLPVVADFMHEAGDGSIVENEVKVVERHYSSVTKEDAVIVDLLNVSVSFPVKRNFFGKAVKLSHAVDNVSLKIKKGETLGLVGESGCGKTTLGRTMLGLIQPTAGTVMFNGKNMHEVKEATFRRLRKDVQLIFQDPYSSLNPRQRIGKAIGEAMRIHRLVRNEEEERSGVVELMVKVGLKPEHYYRYPHEFSGGQRQRIVIARALALKPSFIVCDESVSALDVSVQAQVLNLLNDLKEEMGFTAVFISHDLSVVRYISDRIAVMKAGKLVELGDAEQVYNQPLHEYTKQLLQAIPSTSLNRQK